MRDAASQSRNVQCIDICHKRGAQRASSYKSNLHTSGQWPHKIEATSHVHNLEMGVKIQYKFVLSLDLNCLPQSLKTCERKNLTYKVSFDTSL